MLISSHAACQYCRLKNENENPSMLAVSKGLGGGCGVEHIFRWFGFAVSSLQSMELVIGSQYGSSDFVQDIRRQHARPVMFKALC